MLFLQKSFQAKPSRKTPSPDMKAAPWAVSMLSCDFPATSPKPLFKLLSPVLYHLCYTVRSPQKGTIQLIFTTLTVKLEGTRYDGDTMTITVALIKSFRN